MGTQPLFTKGNNFCGIILTSLDESCKFLKERICCKWSKFFNPKIPDGGRQKKKPVALLPMKVCIFALKQITFPFASVVRGVGVGDWVQGEMKSSLKVFAPSVHCAFHSATPEGV